MNLTQVCNAILEGRKIKAQARQLSNDELAKKFGYSRRSIAKIADGMPSCATDEDRRLILACISERDKLRSKSYTLSLNYLCKQHGYSHHTVLQRLECMGKREVAV